ncbi:hypothetical protein [Brevibacterium oceani]|uniref:hypothetical protein n=1 Tax=Brevibacterium oceani TaxID=358099 RepID=UPI0015E76E17|nr:hypothetical protein [Brevibacterium oceani]
MTTLITLITVFLIALLGLIVVLAALAMPVGMLVGSISGVDAVMKRGERRSSRPEMRRQLVKSLMCAVGPPAVLITCVALMKGLAHLALWLTA